MYYKSGNLVFVLLTLLSTNIYSFDQLELNKITTNHKNIPIKPPPKSIQLYSNSNDLFVEFKLIAGDSVSYKYQLTNYELDWTEINYPTIRYMNLPKGNYQLFVIARQNSKEIAHYYLDVIVEKSISEQAWFYPMLAFYGILLIGGGIYLFFLYNFRQKMKVQKLRNKIASDLHDEVGSTLSSIAISSNFVKNNMKNSPAVIQSMLNRMKIDSEETVHAIRDTVWALNPQNDSIHILIEKIHSFAKQLLVGKGISLLFVNTLPLNKNIVLNIESRKNFFLIAKELLNNIAKHSEATDVNLTFDLKKESILLTIQDNGKGFDYNANYDGNGLKNLKRRAEESFMDLEFDSKIGEGTKIKLVVPVI